MNMLNPRLPAYDGAQMRMLNTYSSTPPLNMLAFLIEQEHRCRLRVRCIKVKR